MTGVVQVEGLQLGGELLIHLETSRVPRGLPVGEGSAEMVG